MTSPSVQAWALQKYTVYTRGVGENKKEKKNRISIKSGEGEGEISIER